MINLVSQAMNEKVSIFVPSKNSKGESISTDKIISYEKEALIFLSELFGGATSQKMKGSYLNDEGLFITERVNKIYSYANTISKKDMKKIYDFCERMKKDLEQETIGVEYNNSFYLI